MPDRHPDFFAGTEMPDFAWWQALWPAPCTVLAALGMAPGMRVIDLCCGDGWFTLQMAKLASYVTAIDIDPEQLAVARARAAQSKASNCNFVIGSAYDLVQLIPHPVDFLLMANSFHGVHDKPRLGRAVHDCLRPGGRFAIVNWHARPREETVVLGEPRGPRSELRMCPDETVKAVEPTGLKHLQLVELPPYHYGAVFERGTCQIDHAADS